MRIYLQSQIACEQAPKFYQISLQEDLLEGWNLMREWGYQGQRGRNKHEHFSSYDEAQNALIKIRDQQIKHGFRVVFMQGQEQP